jgi:hypothetical protein
MKDGFTLPGRCPLATPDNLAAMRAWKSWGSSCLSPLLHLHIRMPAPEHRPDRLLSASSSRLHRLKTCLMGTAVDPRASPTRRKHRRCRSRAGTCRLRPS